MNEDIKALIKAVQENEELHVQTKEIEEKLKAVVDEYIELGAEYGVTLTEDDFRHEDIKVLVEAEDSNEELKEKAASLETQLQKYVNDYIAVAKKYGLTLEASDFNPRVKA